jgi:hypothetical protein
MSEQGIIDEKTRKVASALKAALSLIGEKSPAATADFSESHHPNDRQLRSDLAICLDAESALEAEIERLKRMSGAFDGEELRAIEYQTDLAMWQTERASQEAARRLELLRSLKTQQQREAEIKRCRQDTVYWLRNYAWTADPRSDAPLPVAPFLPFDFQVDTLRWLESLIFLERKDGLIDKSRDMGLSWLIVALAVKHWLFGARFDALFGSRKEDLVDKKGSLDSLFEKIRFLVRRLPSWMLPIGFNEREHSTYMRLINPATGSALTGESSNTDFGRAGRYTAIFLDEFASFPSGGYEAWTACSQSSRSKIVFSTPKGKLNKFSDLRFGSQIAVKSLHWRLHPWKDERWYESQARTMSAEEIAQELDLDYEASQPGRIFPMWSEPYHVITWSEFAAFYDGDRRQDVRDSSGRIRIPTHWEIGRAQDWGSTEDHPTITLWAAVAAENAALAGSVFFYREWKAPTGSTPREVAEGIKYRERYDDEKSRIRTSLMSHEAKSERDSYNREHGLWFRAWETGYTEGIAQMQDYLQPDMSKHHPFRPFLKGCPKLFIIVADDQGRIEQSEGKHFVRSARDDDGIKRLREEMPLYHYPESERGKPVKARKPFKIFDDAVDCARALARQFFLPIRAKSQAERYEESLPEHLRIENAPPYDDGWKRDGWEMARAHYRQVRRMRENRQGGDLDDPWNPRSPFENVIERNWSHDIVEPDNFWLDD